MASVTSPSAAASAAPEAAAGRPELLAGFGRIRGGEAAVVRPASRDDVRQLIEARPRAGLIARGAGLSYGDAAQNTHGVVVSPVAEPEIHLDAGRQLVTATAGTTFAQILARVVPAGFVLPVLPGTRHLTVGGAIAADVHGKNHATAGSLSAWLKEVSLLDGSAQLRTLSRDADQDGFLATVGGMGLTGVIVSATLRLRPITTPVMAVSSHRTTSLDATLQLMATATAPYRVAWIDATAAGTALGRGIVELADHADLCDVPDAQQELRYHERTPIRVPSLPVSVVTHGSARAFNSLWYRRAPAEKSGLASLASFFHRLDAVDGWNKLTGSDGLVQYQFVVPDGSEKVLVRALEVVQRNRCAPFLGTLKRFGTATGGALSFPQPGWCLALDMPGGHRHLDPLLTWLDMQVAGAGGRVYLAKDVRLGEYAFNAMYGPVSDWREARKRLDGRGLFQSDLGRRVGLC